jgi:hypothetical protein
MEFFRRKSEQQLNEEAKRAAQGDIAGGKDLIRSVIETGAVEPGAVRLHARGPRVEKAFVEFRSAANLSIAGIPELAARYRESMLNSVDTLSLAEKAALLKLATQCLEEFVTRKGDDQ